ncbi:24823_t:CDS:1, partial [Racocetra persica]
AATHGNEDARNRLALDDTGVRRDNEPNSLKKDMHNDKNCVIQ